MPEKWRLLRFATDAPTRTRLFTRSMERATIIALAQMHCKRKPLTGRRVETLITVAKGYFPILINPWREGCLYFDGLGLLSHSITYGGPSNLDGFLGTMRRDASHRQAFLSKIKGHSSLLKNFAEEKKIEIRGLISQQPFLKEIEAMSTDFTTDISFFLPLLVTQGAITQSIGKLEVALSMLRESMGGLQYVSKELSMLLDMHRNGVQREVEHIKSTLDATIAKAKPQCDKKISTLKTACEKETQRVSRVGRRHSETLERTLARLERDSSKFKLRYSRLTQQLERCLRTRDSRREKYLKEDLKACVKDLSQLQSRMKECQSEIQRHKKATDSESIRIREAYDSKIRSEMEVVEALQAKKGNEEKIRLSQLDQISQAVSNLTADASSLTVQLQQREQEILQLAKLATPPSTLDAAHIALPFYIAQYEGDGETRFQIFPPVIAQGASGFMHSLQRKISGSQRRLTMLMKPRSTEISHLLCEMLTTALHDSPPLADTISNEASGVNLLKNSEVTSSIHACLAELSTEGWLDEDEATKVAEFLNSSGWEG